MLILESMPRSGLEHYLTLRIMGMQEVVALVTEGLPEEFLVKALD